MSLDFVTGYLLNGEMLDGEKKTVRSLHDITRVQVSRRVATLSRRRGRPLRHTDLGIRLIKNDVDALEENVSQDVKRIVTAGLDTSESHSTAGVTKGKVFRVDGELSVSDGKSHSGNCGGGRIYVSSLGIVELGSADALVNSVDGGVVEKAKSCSSVGNGSVSRAVDCCAVDGGRGATEHPEALRAIDGSVNDVAVGDTGLDRVDNSEGVKAVGITLVEGNGEETLLDNTLVDHVFNRGCLRGGRDGVQGGPREAEKAIGALALRELGGELLSELDGLGRNGDGTDLDGVVVDVPGRGRPVTVGNIPSCAGEDLGGARILGVVDSVALSTALDLTAPDPEVRAPSVKVHAQGDPRGTDSDWDNVLEVALDVFSGDLALLGASTGR